MNANEVALRLQELRDEIRALPWDGTGWPRLIPLREEGARLADSVGDEKTAFWFRLELAGAACNLGRIEQALVPLSWCMATFDRIGSQFPAHFGDHLLAIAATALGSVHGHPDIPRADIDRLLTDVERRWQRGGLPARGMLERRQLLLMSVGDLDRAAEAFTRWRSLPRDTSRVHTNKACLYDCDKCEAAGVMEWFLALGDDEKALAAARPVLDDAAPTGKSCSDEMRAWIFAHALAPLLRLGRVEEARTYHPRGLRMVADDPSDLDRLAPHLVFLAATGQAVRALPLVERHLTLAGGLAEHERYDLDIGVWLVVLALARQGETEITLRLPDWHPAHQPSGRYDATTLAKHLETPLRALAARYDTRNGNPYVSSQLDRQQAVLDVLATS